MVTHSYNPSQRMLSLRITTSRLAELCRDPISKTEKRILDSDPKANNPFKMIFEQSENVAQW